MGCSRLTPDQIGELIKKTWELTDKPFGVDILAPPLSTSGSHDNDLKKQIPREYWDFVEKVKRDMNIPDFDSPDYALTEEFLRQARATAMATTAAYRVLPDGPGALMAQTASSCSSPTWTTDPDLRVELPRDVEFSNIAWNVCFSGRGMADTNVVVELRKPQHRSQRIEVLRGGSTRVLP